MGVRELAEMATDATIATAANKVTVFGGGAAFLIGGLTVNEVAALGGLVLAAVSMLIQMLYTRRSNKRQEAADARQAAADERQRISDAAREVRELEEHAVRMAVLRKKGESNV